MTETKRYEVIMTGDLAFAEIVNADGRIETLRLDVYSPRGAHGKHPAVLWMHGGRFKPFNNKRQKYITILASALASRGYVGIAPDYRVRANPDADMPGTVRDAVSDGRKALEWVREHPGDLNIDLARLAIAGGSAGGMLILNLVHSVSGPVQDIRALVNMWGTPAGKYRYFERVNPGSPPTLTVHGTNDDLVPFQHSLEFTGELTQAGVYNKLVPLKGGKHPPMQHLDQVEAALVDFLALQMG